MSCESVDGLDSSDSALCRVASCCGHGNEPTYVVNGEEFLPAEWLSVSQETIPGCTKLEFFWKKSEYIFLNIHFINCDLKLNTYLIFYILNVFNCLYLHVFLWNAVQYIFHFCSVYGRVL
jgi:hypothetical protein